MTSEPTATRPDPDPALCLNCQAPLHGRFCARCGQERQELRVPLRELMGDVFRDLFQWDSRFVRTLRALVLEPGELTLEHGAGRRVRYLPPLRLYFVSSVVFIVLVGAFGDGIQIGVSLPDRAKATEPAAGGGALRVSGSVDFLGPLSPLVDQGLQVAEEEPDRVRIMFFKSWSWVLFLLMPGFAVLLALFFRGSQAYYVEHLVFALHFHAFKFLALSAALLVGVTLGGWVAALATLAVVIWIPAYLLLSLRRVYGESYWKIVPKAAVLASVYAVALGLFTGVVTLATLIIVA